MDNTPTTKAVYMVGETNSKISLTVLYTAFMIVTCFLARLYDLGWSVCIKTKRYAGNSTWRRGVWYRSVVANVLCSKVMVNEFELQLHTYIHFRTNTRGKGKKILFRQIGIEYCHYCFATRMALALNYPQRLICHQTKKRNPTKNIQSFVYTQFQDQTILFQTIQFYISQS